MAKKKAPPHGGKRPGAGRPRRFKDPKTLSVVVESEDYALIEKAAENASQSLGDWVREQIISAANERLKLGGKLKTSKNSSQTQ